MAKSLDKSDAKKDRADKDGSHKDSATATAEKTRPMPGAAQVSAPTGQLNCGIASFGVSAT